MNNSEARNEAVSLIAANTEAAYHTGLEDGRTMGDSVISSLPYVVAQGKLQSLYRKYFCDIRRFSPAFPMTISYENAVDFAYWLLKLRKE